MNSSLTLPILFQRKAPIVPLLILSYREHQSMMIVGPEDIDGEVILAELHAEAALISPGAVQAIRHKGAVIVSYSWRSTSVDIGGRRDSLVTVGVLSRVDSELQGIALSLADFSFKLLNVVLVSDVRTRQGASALMSDLNGSAEAVVVDALSRWAQGVFELRRFFRHSATVSIQPPVLSHRIDLQQRFEDRCIFLAPPELDLNRLVPVALEILRSARLGRRSVLARKLVVTQLAELGPVHRVELFKFAKYEILFLQIIVTKSLKRLIRWPRAWMRIVGRSINRRGDRKRIWYYIALVIAVVAIIFLSLSR